MDLSIKITNSNKMTNNKMKNNNKTTNNNTTNNITIIYCMYTVRLVKPISAKVPT